MADTSPIKFAILGAGHIGKRHAEVISKNLNAELVAICECDQLKHSELMSFEVPLFEDYNKLLNSDVYFDVLSIATPNGLHAEHALAGLNNGKHVIVEKPLALHVEECIKMIEKSEEVSKHVFCVMQNRYSPPSIWLKNLLNDGILGNIYSVQINCFWNRDERYYTANTWRGDIDLDGGTLFTQFSHFIDMLYWLFGDIKNIHSKFNNFNHSDLTDFEDSGTVLFDFVNGGEGSIHYSTSLWDSNLESSILIIAQNGTVKIGGQYMNEVEYCNIKDYVMPVLDKSNPPNDYGNYKGSAANHQFVIQNVLDVLTSDVPISTNAKEGLKVVEIIERIYQTNPYIKKKK